MTMDDLTKEDWPKFSARRVTPRGSQFRVGTRDVYVDIPTQPIRAFMRWVHSLEDEKDSPLEAYETIQESIDEANQDIRQAIQGLTREDCSWIRVSVREMPMANKPYNIQVRINWSGLLEFLDSLAKSDKVPLPRKYQYIFSCRNIQLTQDTRGDYWISESEQEKVLDFAEDEIKACIEDLDRLEKEISSISKKCRNSQFQSLFYLYSQDFMFSLDHLEQSFHQGRITSSYRELRKILEELTVALFYDKLMETEQNFDNPLFLPYPDNEWFNNAKDKDVLLRSLGDLKNGLGPLIEAIDRFYGDGISKRMVWDLIVDRLSVSLFLVGASTDKSVSDFEHVPESIDKVETGAVKTVESVLLDFRHGGNLSAEEKDFAEESVTELLPSGEFQVKFPTGSFTRQFVSKYFYEDLNQIFNRYSFFAHAYPGSWQIAPASSILEYKIFRRELENFSRKVESILNDYETIISSF